MGGMSIFMASNKKTVPNKKIVVTESFADETGKPVEWEVRCISSEENEVLQRDCMKQAPVPGKRNQYRQVLDFALYARKLAAACTVYPNLNDAEVQDSYGVKCAEDLIVKLLDNPGDFAAYVEYLMNFCKLDRSISDMVEEAKN